MPPKLQVSSNAPEGAKPSRWETRGVLWRQQVAGSSQTAWFGRRQVIKVVQQVVALDVGQFVRAHEPAEKNRSDQVTWPSSSLFHAGGQQQQQQRPTETDLFEPIGQETEKTSILRELGNQHANHIRHGQKRHLLHWSGTIFLLDARQGHQERSVKVKVPLMSARGAKVVGVGGGRKTMEEQTVMLLDLITFMSFLGRFAARDTQIWRQISSSLIENVAQTDGAASLTATIQF